MKTPLDDPEYKIKGKVLCLVDTDAQLEIVTTKPESNAIDFLRLIYDANAGDVRLVKMDDQLVSPSTEIEHALEGARFVKTVKEIGGDNGGTALKLIVDSADHCDGALCSYAYLDLAPSANRKMMEEYFDVKDNKVRFAAAYVKTAMERDASPQWVEAVRSYFLPSSKKTKPKIK